MAQPVPQSAYAAGRALDLIGCTFYNHSNWRFTIPHGGRDNAAEDAQTRGEAPAKRERHAGMV